MIVYNREIKKEDINNLDIGEELIYYRDNNIAFTINQINNSYIVRKKKIFNNQMIDERCLKTAEQIIKAVD